MPIIPDTKEAEIAGSQCKAGLNKSMIPYVKNKLKKAKRLGAWLN
jgi:hypothetical protein